MSSRIDHASRWCPSPATDIDAEIGGEGRLNVERGECLGGTLQEHSNDANNDSPSGMVDGLEEVNIGHGVGNCTSQEHANDGSNNPPSGSVDGPEEMNIEHGVGKCTSQEHDNDGSNDPPSGMVDGPEEVNIEHGVGKCTSQEHANNGSNNPPSGSVDGPEEVNIEHGVGEHNVDGSAKPTSNIVSRVKDKPRIRTQSVSTKSPYVVNTYVRKKKMTKLE